jgi:hypothetical protein
MNQETALTTAQQKISPHLEEFETYLKQWQLAQTELARLSAQMKLWAETLNNDILLLDTVPVPTETIRNERKMWVVYIQSRLDQLKAT